LFAETTATPGSVISLAKVNHVALDEPIDSGQKDTCRTLKKQASTHNVLASHV
jgi:hypothetical protein